jgi:hypothetical protein
MVPKSHLDRQDLAQASQQALQAQALQAQAVALQAQVVVLLAQVVVLLAQVVVLLAQPVLQARGAINKSPPPGYRHSSQHWPFSLASSQSLFWLSKGSCGYYHLLCS